MRIPTLIPSKREREYNQRSQEEVSKIVYTWLFNKNVGHREMDRDILHLDPATSKGWQSMGVLHYLGLKKDFKGLFYACDLKQAADHLKANSQNFDLIIDYLQNQAVTEEWLADSIYKTQKTINNNFENNFRLRLKELTETDIKNSQTYSRKEQAILRAILFKGAQEAKCAICLKTFPTNIMVAAHIKPRNRCNSAERKNPNIVMPVCKVGCDEFFEKGYIIVDKVGVIRMSDVSKPSQDLHSFLVSIAGNQCTHFNQNTEDFFAAKRDILLKV